MLGAWLIMEISVVELPLMISRFPRARAKGSVTPDREVNAYVPALLLGTNCSPFTLHGN